MIRLASWLLGFSIGASFGALIVMLFVPQTANEIRYRLRTGYEETMAAAQLASETRRRELEAELARRQGRALPVPGVHPKT
jgi:gas vesicle protein